VVDFRGKVMALPITEIVPKTAFFDYEQKYSANGADEITPARISAELTNEIQETVVRVFKLLDCKNMARIDFIIKDNKPYLLEVNTLPGLSSASILPKQAKEAGIDLTELFTGFTDKMFAEVHNKAENIQA
jgi:D-alanine-D-alanine ligase